MNRISILYIAGLIMFLGLSGASFSLNPDKNSFTYAENQWKTLDDPLYSLTYPGDWELNYTGQMGISMAAVAPKESPSDRFRENVTLMIQEMKDDKTTLEAFVNQISEGTRSMIINSELVENKEAKGSAGTYREIQYTGDQGGYELIYTQRFYLHKGKAFIFSFTAERSNYEKHKAMGFAILNSLQLK